MEDPPYRRIANGIAARIAVGELAPGAPIPSTRALMAEHGIAMATATKILTVLREQGLVEAVRGVGTVVAHARPAGPDRDGVIAAAIAIADAEGLAGLSMRRLAGQLGVPTMAVYRFVQDKEELVLLMMDRVMAGNPPPGPAAGRDGWRTALEALARLQWSMYRRHTWLAQAVSFTRPLPAPHAMAHTEFSMRALEGCGLDRTTQFTAAVMVANYVRGTAVNLAEEAQAEQDSGQTSQEWMQAQQDRLATAFAGGRVPLMTGFITGPDAHHFTLDRLFEFGLQRVLDGLAPLIRPM